MVAIKQFDSYNLAFGLPGRNKMKTGRQKLGRFSTIRKVSEVDIRFGLVLFKLCY
jgi:hypothetical protein